ncbi:MAG TPA: TonB-dependent receptor [Pyrinomonadaceae bacterium]
MRKILPFFIGILLFSSAALAQSQATTGNIEGRVLDPNGAAVPNVNVSATNKDTGFGKTVMADAEGNYVFVLLPPGNYKVEAKAASGFNPTTYDNVVVTVGGKTTIDITLSVGTGTTVVDVQGEGAVVETTRTSISTTVDERRVINLPTNGRNFLDFATLAPGIVRDPTRAGDLAVGGQKGTLNSIQIDGTSSDNTFFGQSSGRIGSGRAPSQFSIDTVQEFQVNQNGFSAEFGRAAGAVINVVTKSGKNYFFGSAFEYFRDESLNARNPNLVAANRARPAGQINQFGGTVGGPIRKDKAFFFGAYEGQRSNLPNPVVLNSLNSAPANVQSLLKPKINSYNIDREQDTFLGKVDFNINESNQLWVRFNQQNFTGTNLESASLTSTEEHTGNSNVKTSALTTQWTHSFTPNWLNEFRFQFSRDKEPGLANSEDPELNLTVPEGTLSIGRNNFSPRETTITRYQFVNNQTVLTGNHTIKYGADLLFDRIFNFFPGLFSGSYTFNGGYAQLSNYLNGTGFPTSYRQSFAGPGTDGAVSHPNNSEYGFFLQDDWRVTPKLTLNLGVRYDYQSIAKPPITNDNPITLQDPNSFTTRTTSTLLAQGYDTGFRPSDKNNLAPRLGFSYAFNEKTVLRGGYGLFYGRTTAIMTGTAHTQNGIQVLAFSINCSAANPCPTYPNVLTSIPAPAFRAPVSLYLFDQDYKQPYTHQARAQFERELFKNTTFSVNYTMFRGVDLSRTRNDNLFAPVDVTVGGLTFKRFQSERERFGDAATNNSNARFRPIRDFDRISLFESTAKSFYQGLTFEFNRRFSNRWQFNTSYTLSKAKDDKPDQTSVVPGGGDDAKIAENQYDLSGEYGRSDLDVRHRFIFSTVYETGTFRYSENRLLRALLSDYVLTGIFTAQSGLPYSALVSGDPNGDGINSTDRVPGTRRNEFSTPASYIFDLRVGRIIRFGERMRLSLFAEGFNIFNRPNVQLVFNNQYAAVVSNGRLTGLNNPPATAPFQAPRQFISGSPSFAFNSSYNREFQLGIRFDF